MFANRESEAFGVEFGGRVALWQTHKLVATQINDGVYVGISSRSCKPQRQDQKQRNSAGVAHTI